jgi:DNA (cytosine-5)-methyltransferase 1
MCEIDKQAQQVLKAHWPDVPLFTDVKEVTGESLRALGLDPRHTVITGGFPCQDLSTAGKRAGLDGARSGLFWEVIRILDEFHPQWVVLENVSGLLNSQSGRDMGTVVTSLEKCGYEWAYRVLDSQNFGVPQRRRRVFIVGHFGTSSGRPAEVLAISKVSSRNPEQGQQAGQEPTRSDKGGA